jgi:protein tyrosine/serine phosphatase
MPMIRLISFVLLLPNLAAARMLADPQEGDIPRFGILAEGLYRGGQPTQKGFQFLKEKGIKTIINLRAEDNSEQALVEKLGMKYIRIAIPEVRPWSQIPQGAIAKYFELVNNPENYPIFFHCRRGADRTGFLAAVYRMALQGWDAKKAYNEARDIGMRWYFGALKQQIYDFHPPATDELQPAIKKQ